jgi:hypothetical protein
LKDGFNSGGYEWCCLHWGTKWGICEAELTYEKKKSLKYAFRTAWSPPLPIIKKMGTVFPQLKFILSYFEGGSAFRGRFVMENGENTSNETGYYHGQRGG